MTGRIERAIDVFLDAINKGTLAKGKCSACAVGNLVAHGIGMEIDPIRLICVDIGGFNTNNTHWGDLFCTVEGRQFMFDINPDSHDAMANIKSTEFTFEELAKIEFAFETSTQINGVRYKYHTKEEVRADQIKGLEAVIKVMLEFDDQKLDVKEIFTKKADLIPIN